MSASDDRPGKAPAAQQRAAAFQQETLDEVKRLVADNDVVVVGMGWNPHVRRACKALEAGGVDFQYKQIGNYAAQWRPRLAVKLWSGWPTFPQVFVKGTLIGGADETEVALKAGEIAERLGQ